MQIDGTLRDGGGKFVWSHSYSKVHQAFKEKEYDTYRQFLNFASLNVENRPRVKCVSAKEGKTSFDNYSTPFKHFHYTLVSIFFPYQGRCQVHPDSQIVHTVQIPQ